MTETHDTVHCGSGTYSKLIIDTRYTYLAQVGRMVFKLLKCAWD